jgi:hypothetical protein
MSKTGSISHTTSRHVDDHAFDTATHTPTQTPGGGPRARRSSASAQLNRLPTLAQLIRSDSSGSGGSGRLGGSGRSGGAVVHPAPPPVSEIEEVAETPPVAPPPPPTAPPAARATPRRPTVNDVAHNMRNPAPKHESTQTSSLFTRVRTRPAKGVQLPQTGPALAPAKLPPRMRPAPPPPALGDPLPKGSLGIDRSNYLKTMRTAVKQIAPEVPKPAKTGKPAEPMAALNDEVAMKDHVWDMFAQPRNQMASAARVTTLLNQLMPALAGPPAPTGSKLPADPPATSFPFTQHLLVGEHLAQACGRDPERATAALAVLRSGLEVDAMVHDLKSGTLQGAGLDALRTAAGLASTHAGFQALLKMIQPPPAPERQAGMQRLLTAAVKVSEELKLTHGDSLAQAGMHAALKVATGAPASLAETVLAVEMRMHAAPAVEGASPYAALPPAHKAAVFAWKQGFRESGPGSDLSKLQGRLAKFGKYVARAAKHEKHAAVKLDPRKPATAVPFMKAQAKLAMTSVHNAFGRKKSPLDPLRSMGVNNAAQGHPDENMTALDKHVGTAMTTLSEHLTAHPPEGGVDAHALATPGTPLPPAVERSALLNHVTGTMEQTRPLGHVLDKNALMQVALDIAAQHGVPESGVQALAAKLTHWEGKSVTLANVRAWAKDAGLHESEPAPAGSPTANKETAFGAAMRKAEILVDPANARPADLTPDGVQAFVRNFMQEHQWGAVATASNGGTLGFNANAVSIGLKKASEQFTSLLSGTGIKASVAPVADVRVLHASNAVFSFGTSHHGAEVFLGTQRQTSGALGGGIATSLRKGFSKFGLQGGGAATVTPLAGDITRVRGVMVRTMREENPDGEGWNAGKSRDEMVKFVDTMFALAKGPDGAKLDPARTWEHLASEFLESDTLSIGWQSQASHSVHHTATASANFRATGIAVDKPFESAGAGIAGSITADATSTAANRRTERTGDHRMIRNNALSRFQVNASVSGTTIMPTVPVAGGSGTFVSGTATDPTSETLNRPIPLLGKQKNFSLVDQGANTTFRALVDNGRLSETYTLREVDYRDPAQFKAMVAEPGRHEQLERVFVAAHGPEEGPQEMQKFMSRVENWSGPGQRYAVRSRLRADVRKGLDESAALASAIHARNPNDPRLAQIGQHMMARLSDEHSWVPMQMQAIESQSAADVRGLNFGAVAMANRSVGTDRELYATAAPPDVVRAWAQQPATPAPRDPETGGA